MFDNPKELLDKIRLGESTFLEFKEVRFVGEKIRGPNRDSLADGLAPFANSRGGMFVLGIEDKTHEVGGISMGCLDAVVDFVWQGSIGSIDPPIESIVLDRLWLSTITEDELAIVKAEVSAAKDAHLLPSSTLPALTIPHGSATEF